MSEDFLQYLWKYRLFDASRLTTHQGEPIHIQQVGAWNSDAGPDFFDARLKIGDKLWAGNVEVHIRSSDWNRHGHHQDAAYNNVILHVVHEYDEEVMQQNGTKVTTAELFFDEHLWDNYNRLLQSKTWIPCENNIHRVSKFEIRFWLEKLLVERLERKSADILHELEQNKNNWEEAFYHKLARNFGFNLNAEPFELLAKSLPLNYLAKHKNNREQLEAMLYGQAGMLEENLNDDYYLHLQKEYRFFQRKFNLQPIESHLWKFLRLRPASFPTIRISQFADLIYQSNHLFSRLLEIKDIPDVRKLFNVKAAPYWQTHYKFGKSTEKRAKNLGKTAIDGIIINTVVPFVFVYGKQKGKDAFRERALDLLSALKPERNAIIKNWQRLGINAENAYDSQALIQLKNEYCSRKRCLECRIGNQLIRRK